MKIVCTYTTLPGRYGNLYASFLSIKKQTYKVDKIYLTIANSATRLDLQYPPFTEEINKLVEENFLEIVTISQDKGPITKIYGALFKEQDNDTVIISCDDDVIFQENHIEILIKHHIEEKNIAITGTGALLKKGLLLISIVTNLNEFVWLNQYFGFSIGKQGRKVDMIFGVSGVLYTRGMFPTNENLDEELFKYPFIDRDIFLNDDMLISGYLSKKGITRKVFSDIPSIFHNEHKEDALSKDFFKMLSSANACKQKLKQYGFFPQMEELNNNETFLFRALYILTLIIAIIALIICF